MSALQLATMPFRFVETPLPTGPLGALSPSGKGGVSPDLASALLAGPGAEANRARLLRQRPLVVTTGQQPGLFTGPLYGVYKALSAAALAAELEQQWDRPVVPVFWLAGDDHDYAEARGTAWLNPEGHLISGALPDRPADAPADPMYRLPLGPEITQLLGAFERDHPIGGFRQHTMEWLRRHYRPGATVGAAYAGAMSELLGPFGILCFDPTHPDARHAMAPTLLAALRGADALEAAIADRSAELAGDGRPVNMVTGDGSTLVLLEAKHGRDRLVRDGNGFRTRRSRERFSLADLEAIAASDPQRLSPNVLLRPVVERALLPTVAYLAGPGELGYLPLTAPVYRQLGIEPQLPVARWSACLIERRVDRVLDKFNSSLEELAAPGQALERRVVRAQLPPAVPAAVARLRKAFAGEFGLLVEAGGAIDPTIARSIDAARHRGVAALERAEKKLESALRRRESIEMAQIERARTAIQPDGKPQERVLGVASFLARHGPGFLEEAARRIRDWYHQALVAAKVPS